MHAHHSGLLQGCKAASREARQKQARSWAVSSFLAPLAQKSIIYAEQSSNTSRGSQFDWSWFRTVPCRRLGFKRRKRPKYLSLSSRVVGAGYSALPYEWAFKFYAHLWFQNAGLLPYTLDPRSRNFQVRTLFFLLAPTRSLKYTLRLPNTIEGGFLRTTGDFDIRKVSLQILKAHSCILQLMICVTPEFDGTWDLLDNLGLSWLAVSLPLLLLLLQYSSGHHRDHFGFATPICNW